MVAQHQQKRLIPYEFTGLPDRVAIPLWRLLHGESKPGRYLLNPQVTVSIDEYRNFYVNGMVEKPGGYPYSPGLTVRKAISIAGGFKERAARDKINVIHDDDPKQTPQKVDLNTALLPGDIVTVEESFF